MRPLIYIAGPIEGSGLRELNLAKALQAAERMVEMDIVPVVPHIYGMFWGMFYPKSQETWLNIDSEYILRCDGLFRLTGASSGADGEVSLIKALNRPVFFDFFTLAEWRKTWKFSPIQLDDKS